MTGRTVRGTLDPERPNGFRFRDLPVHAAPETAIEAAFTGRAPAAPATASPRAGSTPGTRVA